MPRRVGRPGLVGTMARTAVVAGTATAVSNKVSGASDKKAAVAAQDAYQQGVVDSQVAQQQTPVQSSSDPMAELEKLGELHQKGILTDEEFATKKQELLAKV